MVSATVVMKEAGGLQLHSAGRLCQTAQKYESNITIVYNGVRANAKSVLNVLDACIPEGAGFELLCEGNDEQKAMAAMESLLASGGLNEK